MLPMDAETLAYQRFRCERCQTTVSEFRLRPAAMSRPRSATRVDQDLGGRPMLDDETSKGT